MKTFNPFEGFRITKIQTRLVWYYIVFAVFTVALVTYLTYTQAARSLRLTLEDKLSTIATLKEGTLNQWVDDQQGTAIFLASLPELRRLAGIMLDPDVPPQNQMSARDELTALVTLIAQRASDYKDIQILDMKGSIVVSVSPGYLGASQADQLFFIEGQKKNFVQSFYESELFGNTTLTVSTPLFNADNKRVGVLALHFNMKRIDAIIREGQELDGDIQSYLIGPNGQIITDDPIILSGTPIFKSFAIDAALAGNNGVAEYVNHNSVPVIGRYQWIGKRNAAFIIEINERTALWPARRLAVNVALIGLLFSIGLVIVVVFMARRITAPLRALTRTVTNISEGNLDASAPVLSNDEVGTLARAFNSMTEKLRQTMSGLESELRERKQAESAMRDSEEKFRTVFESSPIAICVTAMEDGRILDANYAFWDLTGLTSEKAIGKKAEELRLWDAREKRDQFIENLKQKGSLYNSDDTMFDQDGNKKHTISFFRSVKLGGEERVISMFYDMSTQKQTMQALQQSEARVRALLEAVPDMIVELSLDGLVTSMIPPKGMEQAMPAGDFVGKQVYEIFTESVASQTLFAVERAIQTNQMNVFEFEVTMGATKRIMEARVVANTSDTALMMVRDITQRKWIETEREELISQLEAKNRESETLRESLTSIVTTFDLNIVMERVLDQIKLVIPYDTASVWRLDGELQIAITTRNLPPEIPIDTLKFRIDLDNSSRPLVYEEKAFVLNNNVQDELPDFKGVHSYINSWLAVPLKTRGRVIGLIALDGRRKDQFTQHHAELAITFADQMAVALENANLFNSLQSELEQRLKLIDELKAINAEAETMRESLATIVGTFEFSEIVEEMLDQIHRVIPYDSASVWRVDGKIQRFMAGRNLSADLLKTVLEFPIDERNQSTPLITGEKPYIISQDAQNELTQLREERFNYINSWLGLPLKARGRVIGVIALDGRQKYQFNEHHVELAVAFANQVAIALENADLFSNLQTELAERKDLIEQLERKNAEAETLRESTSIVVATLDIPQTVQRILEQIKRVVQYDSASVWLYEGDDAVMLGSNGLPPGVGLVGRFPISEKEPDYAFFDDRTKYILLHDVQDQYSVFRIPPQNYIHGWLAVPLRARGKLRGFISMDSRQPGKFTEHDAEIAFTFAEQVSIAIENARLFSNLQTELDERQKLIVELELRNIESETLRESTAIVAASSLDIKETVQLVLEQLRRVVQYDAASVWLYHGEKAVIVGSYGLPHNVNPSGEYVRSTDAPDHLFWQNEENPPSYKIFEDVGEHYPIFRAYPLDYVHGWLGVSLRARDKLLGYIALDSRTRGKFTEHDGEMAVSLAKQVSIALETARLFSDLQTELATRKELITELETKNAELERFTYTVSHDLKSPLFTIRGFLGYLESDALSGNHERLKNDVKRIVDATDKMQNLLNDLLELSRVGRVGNELEVIRFGDLVHEAIEIVHGRIAERGIDVHIADNLPMVYGDKVRLIEVVQNLVDNAAKFMGDQPEPHIEIGQMGEENGNPVFYIRDNGIGIAPEHHERVFGLFNKLDVKADGTGIGLALVRRIIEVHGGRIWVESEIGKGAVFCFTLPTPPHQT
ncbi:MAG: GAF domain-containing protein [Anaerolineales bacterium]|nr:GAF domain-containing protein [Anaerolineales bacterium]